jgi:hypothetical protein
MSVAEVRRGATGRNLRLEMLCAICKNAHSGQHCAQQGGLGFYQKLYENHQKRAAAHLTFLTNLLPYNFIVAGEWILAK